MFSMRMASVRWYCPATMMYSRHIWWMMDTAGFQTMEHILLMPSTNNRGSGKWPFLEVHSLKLTTYPCKEVFPKEKVFLPIPFFSCKVLVLGRVSKIRHFSLPMWLGGLEYPISEVETMCLSQPGGCLLYRSLTIEAGSCGKEPMLSVSDAKYDESVRLDHLEEVELSNC